MVCKSFDKLLRACSGFDSSMALDGFRLPWFGGVGYAMSFDMSNQEHTPQCNQYSQYHISVKFFICILFVPFLFAFCHGPNKKRFITKIMTP